MESVDGPARRSGVPSPQKNLDRARELAFDGLTGQSVEQWRWLGAERVGESWSLPVLNDVFLAEPAARRVSTSAGGEVGLHWTILAMHYLAVVGRPEPRPPAVTFADLGAARSYAGVYQARVISRLCATVGRDAERLRAAATALGGVATEGGDAAFDFAVFPRLRLRLIWHAPDEEFPSSATLLLPDNIADFFCSEDIIVLSECLVSRLGGRPF